MSDLATTKGSRMDIFEIEQEETLSREQAAERLHALADMLALHNDLEFERGGMHFTVDVPDKVQFRIELEVEADERELEIEIEMKW